MKILEKVKKTMLLTNEQKKKILKTKLDDDMIKSLEDFFNKYEQKEISIWNDIKKKTSSIMVKTVRYIEKSESNKKEKELKQLEKKINELG